MIFFQRSFISLSQSAFHLRVITRSATKPRVETCGKPWPHWTTQRPPVPLAWPTWPWNARRIPWRSHAMRRPRFQWPRPAFQWPGSRAPQRQRFATLHDSEAMPKLRFASLVRVSASSEPPKLRHQTLLQAGPPAVIDWVVNPYS